MFSLPVKSIMPYIFAILLFTSCTQQKSSDSSTDITWQTVQDSTDRVQSISGFSGPEAVRYDPAQDVYYVSSFNGGGSDRDANGFISKVSPGGTIDSLQFMTGTKAYPLHAPRGMFITKDMLWAADVDGVHGFNRTTGKHVRFIDFTDLEPGFLNDIVQGRNGNLYVTDTGTSKVYQIQDGTVSVVVDSLPYAPNGITLDPSGSQLVLAPWGGDRAFHAWNPADESLNEFGRAEGGGNFDGIEFVNGRLLSASQSDSSLHAMYNGKDRLLINTPGRPADIGLDTQRNQVAVPYVALDRVDIWQLPENEK